MSRHINADELKQKIARDPMIDNFKTHILNMIDQEPTSVDPYKAVYDLCGIIDDIERDPSLSIHMIAKLEGLKRKVKEALIQEDEMSENGDIELVGYRKSIMDKYTKIN